MSMTIRSIDGSCDWNFGKGRNSYNTDANAIGENIKTRLMSFLGDCFFDTQAGIDWFRLLGQRNGEKELILTCKNIILQSYGVVKVNAIYWTEVNRQLTLNFNIDTIFSPNTSQSIGVPNA